MEKLVEAIAAFEAIEDDAECTAAVSKALRDWPELHKRLRALRQSRVQALREQNLTWAQIAEVIGDITPERAQQISRGLSGAVREKAKAAKKRAAEKPPTE